MIRSINSTRFNAFSLQLLLSMSSWLSTASARSPNMRLPVHPPQTGHSQLVLLADRHDGVTLHSEAGSVKEAPLHKVSQTRPSRKDPNLAISDPNQAPKSAASKPNRSNHTAHPLNPTNHYHTHFETSTRSLHRLLLDFKLAHRHSLRALLHHAGPPTYLPARSGR